MKRKNIDDLDDLEYQRMIIKHELRILEALNETQRAARQRAIIRRLDATIRNRRGKSGQQKFY